ncbi:MAG: hypothetical protein WEA58_15085 [Balneolaceae bacterium]
MKTITQTSEFSFDRFLQVCKRFMAINQRTWAIGFAGALGLILAVWLMYDFVGERDILMYSTISSLLQLLYLLGGLILTSSIFNELHNTGSASQLFTLPASTFEKLSAAWFLSYVCYTFIAVILIVLLYTILGFTTDIPESVVNSTITDMDLISQIFSYTTYHSIFFLGAVYFRKNNFMKTALSIILFFLSLVLLQFLLLATGFGSSILYSETILGFSFESATIFRIVISIAITVLFLFFSYIRLKNRQVA